MRLPGEPLDGWRKIASATWRAPNDPQIFGALDVDASAIRAFVLAARASGHHVTATHLAGRAVARALDAVPELNTRIVLGRAFPRPSIDVFFITSIDGGRDLSGVKVERAIDKPAVDIARELGARSRALREGRDPDLARAKGVMQRLPLPLLRAGLRAMSWLTADLGVAVPPLGLRASPFGSAMVSSVGMLGIPMGFAPLVWMYGVPLLVLVGEISDKAVVIDGHVRVRPMLPVTATIDHRYVDGAQIARAMKAFRAYLTEPARFEPPLASLTARGAAAL